MAITQLAIIGTRGHYGDVLAELPRLPQLRLTAIADAGDAPDPLLDFCRKNGHTPRLFQNHEQLLDETRPQMVVVCGPFEQHATMCVQAIERGIHVLTEKPAALNFDELEMLRHACQRHPNIHLAGMMFSRYHPGFYTAARMIERGDIGQVRLLNARKSYKLGKRAAYYHDRATYGGTIPWVGSHAIDWVMWYAGEVGKPARAAASPFRRVFATHSSRDNGNNGSMERSALCLFTLPDDVAASVSIDVFRPSKAPTHGDDWCRVVGTTGVLEARNDSVTLISEAAGGPINVPIEKPERGAIADFLFHAEGRGHALIDAASTLALTDACLRARQSADEARLVDFPAA